MKILFLLFIVTCFANENEEEYELESRPLSYYLNRFKTIQSEVQKDVLHIPKFIVPLDYHKAHHHHCGMCGGCSNLFTKLDRASDEIDYISKLVNRMDIDSNTLYGCNGICRVKKGALKKITRRKIVNTIVKKYITTTTKKMQKKYEAEKAKLKKEQKEQKNLVKEIVYLQKQYKNIVKKESSKKAARKYQQSKSAYVQQNAQRQALDQTIKSQLSSLNKSGNEVKSWRNKMSATVSFKPSKK